MKKLLLLAMLVSLFGGVASATNWIRSTALGTGNWNDPNNWSDGVPTDATLVTTTANAASNLAEIQVTDEQTFGTRLRHGNNIEPTTDGPLLRIMNGGTLSGGPSATRSYIGDISKAKMIVEAGGAFTTSHRLYMGSNAGSHGSVDVFGTVDVKSQKTLVGDAGDGFLNIFPGGVYNAKGFSSGSFVIGDNSIINLIGDGKLVTDGDDTADANALIAGGRFAAWGVLGGGVTTAYDGTDTTITADGDPMLRIPTYGAEVDTVAGPDVDLSWLNLDPSTLTGDVWVDVWFGTDMTWVTDPVDPNNDGYSDFVKIVDANTLPGGMNLTGVTVSAPGTNQKYFWRVDTYFSDPMLAVSVVEPNTVGLVMPFTASDDFPPTIEIVTPKMVTWVGQPITLEAVVTDEGTSEVFVEWQRANEQGLVFSNPTTVIPAGATYPFSVFTDVTVDNDTANFNLNVTATDNADVNNIAYTTNHCVADACAASRYWMIQNDIPVPAGDVNNDCDVDIIDIALLAAEWLDDYTIDEATEIPQ